MRKFNTLFSSIRKGRKLLLTTAMAVSVAGYTHAQTNIANYQFARSTGTYTPITGGTVMVAANATFDDANSPAITIPAFSFGGATITTVYVNTNGYLTFGASHSTSTYTPLSTSGTSVTGVVSAMGCDLGFNATGATTGATSEIRYQQVGDEFVAQWQDVKRYNSTDERLTFQIRLNSTTGIIKIVYGGPVVVGSDTRTPQVGIRGNSTTWASNVNNLNLLDVPTGTTCNWNDAITGNANSSTYTMGSGNAAMVPSNGLTYTWSPSAGPAPVRTFSAVSNITSNGATMTWTAPTGATQYNLQYRIPGACTWTDYSGNPVTGATVTLSGLTPVTTYQVRVQASNGTLSSIWSHIPSSTGTGNGYSTSGTFTTTCGGTPTPGATIVSPNNVCANAPIALSVANPGTGLTYQWQSSADNTAFTNISGATSATLATTATANYYRCVLTCVAGSTTANSTPVQIIYNNNITATTPGTRCGSGTVSLAATGSAGSTVRWYAAATGGTALGSGSPFVTPSINTTTNYYAGAETVAPGTVRVGNGTSSTGSLSYPNPLSAYYGGTKHQLLFLASELTAQGLLPGNITSIAFDVSAINTAGICNDFTIRLGATTATALTGFVAGTTTAYNATYTPSATGVVVFNLTTPFNWNGTSNLIVETVHNAGNTGNGSGTTTRYTTTPFNSVYVRYADNRTPAGAPSFDTATIGTTNAYADRPNIIFGGQTTCSSPRALVTATVNTPPVFTITDSLTICNNAVTALSVTSPVANFNSYTWSPATNLYTNAAGTTPYVAGASASTVYLKTGTAGNVAYIATANNSTTLCAALDTANLTVLPAAATAIATPAAICTSGTTTLALTPASGYGAAKFQWQSSTNNIAFTDVTGATATTYTTPVTTTNVYYRATIKDGANATCFNSASDTARVYNPQITGTTPAARCGTGTVTLGATASEGTLNWYAAATGGASLGTGTSFTTPSISATTTYYVGANSGGTSGNVTLGAGAYVSATTSTFEGTSPYAYHYGNYKHQMLIRASELTAAGVTAGNITSLAFDVVTAGSPVAAFNNFNVTLIPTTLTALTSTFATGGTPVFSATSVTPTVGINTYTFTTPFAWDGTSNVIIQTCYNNNNSGVNASTAEVRYDSTSYISHNIYRVDGTQAGVCSATTGNASNDGPITPKRPKILLGYASSCQSPRTAVIATINAIPDAVITPATSPVQLCQGNTTTFTATGGGNYQWTNAAGNIPGAQSSTFTTGTAGTYRVVVTTPATGCSKTSDPVSVVVRPNPVVFIGNDTAICADYTLTLNAGNPTATYLWDNGATTQTRAVNTAGTYYVKVTDTNTCVKTDTIHLAVNPLPVVNLGNDTAFCQGNTLVLDAGNPGAHYLWNNGTTAQTLNASTTGNYSVVVTDNHSCKGSDNINIIVKQAPSGTINAIYGDTATYTFNVLNAQFVQQYTWNFGDGSPVVTGPVVQHRYIRNGLYLVTLTLGGDCGDSLGRSVTVDVFDAGGGTGIKKLDNPNDLALYPNPAKDQVTIENKNGLKLLRITAYNVLGQVVYNRSAENSERHRMVTTGIAPGMYTLKIETDKGIAIRKIEILK